MKEAIKTLLEELAPKQGLPALSDQTKVLSIGLRSIQIVIFVVKMRNAFGVTLDMKEIVRNPSIGEIAAILESRKAAKS